VEKSYYNLHNLTLHKIQKQENKLRKYFPFQTQLRQQKMQNIFPRFSHLFSGFIRAIFNNTFSYASLIIFVCCSNPETETETKEKNYCGAMRAKKKAFFGVIMLKAFQELLIVTMKNCDNHSTRQLN
jgi:hypothetical protein